MKNQKKKRRASLYEPIWLHRYLMMGITFLQLWDMFSTTMCLHLETSVLSEVAVNTKAAVVGRRQQSSSPLSVSFYEAWEPWSIKAIVALMSGSQMLFTGVLCSASHSGRKQGFCRVCSVHVITSCIHHPLKRKMQDAISAFMQSEVMQVEPAIKASHLPAFSHSEHAILQFASFE